MQLANAISVVPPIHFIGGIHGVGKTTFAAAVSKLTGMPFHSAGALIKQHRDSTQNAAKLVRNVEQNQNLLLDAIKELRVIGPLLLDGHFCLITKDNSISQIPFHTFADLNLKSITVVTDSPANIQHRLAERDGAAYDPDLLDRFQNSELVWAKEVGAGLRVPVATLSCDQVQQATEHIQSLHHPSEL